MLARLTSVGAIAAVGQLCTFLVGAVLLGVSNDGYGISYVQLTSIMQVTQLAAFSLFSADLMFLGTDVQRNAVELAVVRRVVIAVSGVAAFGGALWLASSGSSSAAAISMACIAAFALTLEPVHYGAGRSVRAAWISFAKSALVPAVFIAGWFVGWPLAQVWVWVAIGCVLIAVHASIDARRCLPSVSLDWPIAAIVTRGARSMLRGAGAAANGLQRLVPLALLAQTSAAIELQPVYVFYSAYNLIYGGFRVVSQVLVREHRSADAARRTNRLFGAAWCVLVVLAVSIGWSFRFIPWVLPLVLAVAATLPAAVFLGSHVRMTSLGRFGAYNVANVTGLLVIVVVVMIAPHGAWQLYYLAMAAAAVELGCGLVYYLRDRRTAN